jgi:hypothetical protein
VHFERLLMGESRYNHALGSVPAGRNQRLRIKGCGWWGRIEMYYLPWWMQWAQAIGIGIISAAGVFIAYKQSRIATAKLNLDLYDRRFRVYDAARALIGQFMTDDLPLKFHPVAIRVSADVTPFGAGGATCDRRSWSGLRSRSHVAARLAA